MKLNKLTAAMIAASAFTASSAYAGLVVGVDPVQHEITMSGATASDLGFAGVFAELCTPGTLTTYTDRCNGSETGVGGDITTCALTGPKQPGSSYSAYFCQMTPATVLNLDGPKNVLVRKRSAGGSGWGVQPVADAAAIDQMVINNTNCKPTLADPNVYKCNNTVLEKKFSDMGISDEEPALFVAPNIPSGFTAVTDAQVSKLDFAPVAVLTFGIPVTNALYSALQAAQGLEVDLDGDGLFEAQQETASAADIEANMPNLSQEQVASMMKGGTTFWNDVRVGDDATTAVDESVSLIDAAVAAGLPAPAITDTATSKSRISICRRVNGSGTQAQLNALFLNVPCSSKAELPATDSTICTGTTGLQGTAATCTSGGAPYAGYADMRGVASNKAIIHENSGSGDVEKCMNELQDANRWALGVQSLEKISTKYSYIKIAGASPTLSNVANSAYMDWAATSVQWRNAQVTSTTPGLGDVPVSGIIPAPTGDDLDVMKQLRLDFAKPAVLDVLNDSFPSTFGPVGWLGLTGTARPFNPDLPIMQYTRGASTCNVPKARTAGPVDLIW